MTVGTASRNIASNLVVDKKKSRETTYADKRKRGKPRDCALLRTAREPSSPLGRPARHVD